MNSHHDLPGLAAAAGRLLGEAPSVIERMMLEVKVEHAAAGEPETAKDRITGEELAAMVEAMARNGLDVVASLVPFFNQHTEEFRTMWGGFPPASTGDLAKDAATRLDDLLPGGMMADMYWKYVKQWWPMRDEPNVLLLHYSDVKRDLAGAVSRIASWLGVELTEVGESYYNEYIAAVVSHLEQVPGLVSESDEKDSSGTATGRRAKVIFPPGSKNEHPLIVVKSDGGFGYDSTDMAGIWYRLFEKQAMV